MTAQPVIVIASRAGRETWVRIGHATSAEFALSMAHDAGFTNPCEPLDATTEHGDAWIVFASPRAPWYV